MCSARAGIPDAGDACRAVIRTVKAALSESDAVEKWMEEQRAKVLDRVYSEAKTRANGAYCEGVRLSNVQECLGEAAKMAGGTFGSAELTAHRRVEHKLGAHYGLFELTQWLNDEVAALRRF